MINKKRLRSENKQQLTDIEKEKIRIYWEKKNYNQLNNWCQELKCQLNINQTEVEKCKKFKTQISLIDLQGSLPKHGKIYVESYGPNKKESKTNAMRKITEKLIELEIIYLGIKDWKFFEEIDECQNSVENINEDNNQIKKTSLSKISLCPIYSIKNNNISNNSDKSEELTSNERETKNVTKDQNKFTNKNSNNSDIGLINIRKQNNKMILNMINELNSNNFESAFSIYKQILTRKPLEWGDFSFIWYYSIKQKKVDFINYLLDFIVNISSEKINESNNNTLSNFTNRTENDRKITIINNEDKSITKIPFNDDKNKLRNDNKTKTELPYNNGISFQKEEYDINNNNKTTHCSNFFNENNLNTVSNYGMMNNNYYNNNVDMPYLQIKTINNLSGFNLPNNPSEMVFQQLFMNKNLNVAQDDQNQLLNVNPYNNVYHNNKMSYYNNFNDMNSNYFNNFNSHMTGPQNIQKDMNNNINYKTIQDPIMQNIFNQPASNNNNFNFMNHLNHSQNMFTEASNTYNQVGFMNDNNNIQCAVDILNPEVIPTFGNQLKYKIGPNEVEEESSWNYYNDLNAENGDLDNINENYDAKLSDNSNENIKDSEQYLFPIEFIENIYESLLFSDDLDFAKNVAKIINKKIKYSPSSFISEAAMNYYKVKRYAYFFEISESVYQSVNKLKFDKTIEKISIKGKITKIGNRFAQDVLIFSPTDENIESKIIKKANIFCKENYSQISEREFVLLSDNDKKISTVALIKSIDKDFTCKILVSPFLINDKLISYNWTITKLTNYTSFEKTIEALKKFTTTKACSESILDIIFSQYQSKNNKFIQDLNEISQINLIDNKNYKVLNKYLNDSQKEAIRRARSQVFTLIQGPPGTGKTTIGIEIILEWLRVDPYSQVLVCSDSNVAVDILYRELCKAGVKSFRFGGKNNRINRELSHGHFIRYLKDIQVICTTCVGSLSDYLNQMDFKRLLIDEATQATELATIIPFLKNVKQVVLIGDHKQLSPTVISIDALKEDLGISLFERLVENGLQTALLNTQYRMHPSISNFPSDYFYKSLVVNGINPTERPPILGFQWPNNDMRVSFVNIKGMERKDGSSYYNQEEIAKAVEILIEILKHRSVNINDIGVITPYDAQKKKLQSSIMNAINKMDDFNELLTILQLNKVNTSSENNFLSVDTVDGFQGMDKDLIIFSSVRSNESGNVGFLRDPRRLNVMLTRAKRGLIILGNYYSLIADSNWREWIKWIEYNNAIIKN